MNRDQHLRARGEDLDVAYLKFRGKSRREERRQFWAGRAGRRKMQVEVYWGEATERQRDARAMARLGAIGRYFWPVQACLEVMSPRPISAAALADKILSTLHGNQAFETAVPEHQRHERIVALLRHQHRPYPPAEIADILVQALLTAANQIHPSFEPGTIRAALSDPALRSPSAACEALAAALPEPEPPNDLESCVDAGMRLCDDDGSTSRHAQYCVDIERCLASQMTNDQIQFLVGSSHEGKSTVLRELLRRGGVTNASPASRYSSVQDPAASLPVFAISCRDLTYAELVEEVYVFHSRKLHAPSVNAADLALLKALPARNVLSVIKSGAKRPALYLFADLNVFEPGSVRRSLNGEGIVGLVKVLAGGSDKTRIVISTSHAPQDSDYEVPRRLLDATTHLIRPPELSELVDLLDAGLQPKARALIQTSKKHDRRVPGHILHAAASTMAMMDGVDDELVRLLVDHAAAAPGALPAKRDTGPFFRRILALLERRLDLAALRAFYLLAVSDDGYTTDSLKLGLDAWFALDGVALGGVGDVIDGLTTITHRSGGRMLRRSDRTRLSPFELSASERRQFDQQKHPVNFQIDPPMQRGLCDALRTFNPEAFAIANTLTAKIARQRALNVKIGLFRRYGQSQSDLRRDIQAYCCLLAGLSMNPGPNKPIKAPTLGRLASGESEVFSLEPRAEIRKALRYAYHVLLRTEIDADNRLTMVFDDDTLRLDLLLCLFEGVGKRFWGVARDWPPPNRMPDHLVDAFTPSEIADILLAIAITAHYCSRRDLTDWALARFNEIADPFEDDARLAIQVRLDCIRADNILLGPPPADGERGRQLEDLRKRLCDVAFVAAEGIIDPRRRLKSQVRVLHRIFRIAALHADVSGSRDVFQRIIAAQTAPTEASLEGAEHLGGIAAISLMQTLFGDPVFGHFGWHSLGWSKDDALTWFDDLIIAAAARLSRFGGVERANVAMCRAFRATIAGDYADAVSYSRQARDDIQIATGSAGFRATIFWASAQILFLAGNQEKNVRERRKLLREASEAAKALYGQAKRWNFVTYQARASLLISMLIVRAHAEGIRNFGPARIAESRKAMQNIIVREQEIDLHYAAATADKLFDQLASVSDPSASVRTAASDATEPVS